MVRLGLVFRWGIVAALIFFAVVLRAALCGQEADLSITAFLAVNGAVSLAGAWYLLSRRSPWIAYWAPRLLSELWHWMFDVLWVAMFAALGMLVLPLLQPVLLPSPIIVASILTLRRLRETPPLSPEPLRFWT